MRSFFVALFYDKFVLVSFNFFNMKKLGALGLGVASAATTAIAYLVCSFFFGFYPEMSVVGGSYLMHGIETKIAEPMTWLSFAIGLAVWALVAFVFGVLFAWIYNLFVKE